MDQREDPAQSALAEVCGGADGERTRRRIAGDALPAERTQLPRPPSSQHCIAPLLDALIGCAERQLRARRVKWCRTIPFGVRASSSRINSSAALMSTRQIAPSCPGIGAPRRDGGDGVGGQLDEGHALAVEDDAAVHETKIEIFERWACAGRCSVALLAGFADNMQKENALRVVVRARRLQMGQSAVAPVHVELGACVRRRGCDGGVFGAVPRQEEIVGAGEGVASVEERESVFPASAVPNVRRADR